ncbi:MAG: acyltransferase [Clostridia bacterium]|nr:acyltransferase [Clostridia bacterium]
MDGNSTISPFLSKKITIVSFYFSVLVVLLHSYCVQSFSISASSKGFGKIVYYFQTIICQDLSRCAVPLFFSISGFLFFFGVQRFDQVIKKIKKRFFSLVIPYLLLNVLYTLMEAFLQIVVAGKTVEQFTAGMHSALQFVIRSVFIYQYNVPAWYLFTLILWVALSPIWFFILKRKTISIAALLVFFGLGIVEIFPVPGRENYTLFFFFLGAFMSKYGMKYINSPISKRKIWIPVSLLVFSQSIILFFGFFSMLQAVFVLRFIFEITLAISIWFFADYIIHRLKVKKYYSYSFPIYIFHFIILDIIKLFIIKTSLNNAGSVVCMLSYFVMAALGVVLPILLTKFMNKYAKTVYAVITGGR